MTEQPILRKPKFHFMLNEWYLEVEVIKDKYTLNNIFERLIPLRDIQCVEPGDAYRQMDTIPVAIIRHGGELSLTRHSLSDIKNATPATAEVNIDPDGFVYAAQIAEGDEAADPDIMERPKGLADAGLPQEMIWGSPVQSPCHHSRMPPQPRNIR